MKIYVGSQNPVKVNAVVQAASETWPDVKVKGIDAPSGVGEQPRTNEETKQGATNRAHHILEIARAEGIDQDFLAVGLEGGVFDEGDEMWTTVWAVILDLDGNLHASNGARFLVPPMIAAKIKVDGEMGPVVAEIAGEGKNEIKQKQGMIGVITQGFIDRTEEYSGIVKMALGLWYGRDWHQDL